MNDAISNQFQGYAFSNNYAELWVLSKKTSIICIPVDEFYRDLYQTIYRNPFVEISNGSTRLVCAKSEANFIHECTTLKIQYILPDFCRGST